MCCTYCVYCMHLASILDVWWLHSEIIFEVLYIGCIWGVYSVYIGCILTIYWKYIVFIMCECYVHILINGMHFCNKFDVYCVYVACILELQWDVQWLSMRWISNVYLFHIGSIAAPDCILRLCWLYNVYIYIYIYIYIHVGCIFK